MNFFDLSLRFKGFEIAKAKRHLAHLHSQSKDGFSNYLKTQKQSILRHHIENNSFYRDFAKDFDRENWNAVPVRTKRDLQRPLSERLSDGYDINSVYINKTSGSSGDPFTFAKDKWCHALTWAVIIDRFGWHGVDFNRSKQARFYGIPLDKRSYCKERLKDWLANRFRFSVFDLSDDAFAQCVSKFKNTPFDYINGYTSAIVQFAKYLERKDIILSQICPSLKVCMTTSEMLFEDDRALLETRFGIAIVNEYGASELDLIAFQNKERLFQVNSETLFVEILDENNSPLPYGEEGRIVITSLYNKAHPFIRYDIGDIGALSEESTLQKPILKSLIGRVDDLVRLPSGKKAAGLTFYYITKSIIEDSGKVKAFIIEQLKLDTFKIKYTSEFSIDDTLKQHILKAFETYLEPELKVIFERCTNLERSRSGKLKQFKSYIN